MNGTICNIMLFGGIALAVIFAIAAVVLFIKLDIPKVVGDLTGSTAKKQIKEIRERGYESVQGGGVSKKDAIKAKDSTGKIEVRDINVKRSHSEQLSRQGQERYKKALNDLGHSNATQPTQEITRKQRPPKEKNWYEEATNILNESEDYEEATDVLQEPDLYEEATDVLQEPDLYEEATDVLHLDADDEEATDVLTADADDEEATDVLTADADDEEATDVLTAEGSQASVLPAGFVITTDIVITHTEETI